MNTVEMLEIINKLKDYQCKQDDEIKILKNKTIELEHLICMGGVLTPDHITKGKVEDLKKEVEDLKQEIADLKHRIYSMKRN